MAAITLHFGENAMKDFLLKHNWQEKVAYEDEMYQNVTIDTLRTVTYSNDGKIYLSLNKAFEIELSNQVLKLL